MTRFRNLVLAALVAVPLPAQAATELILNGGFETGDMTGWSCTGGDLCVSETWNPRTGSYSLAGFDNTGFATLSQTVTTTIGSTYDLSFWSSAYDYSGNILRYSLDGGPAQTVTTTSSYTQSTDSFVATGNSTVLSFFFETDGGTGSWYIDDVSMIGATSAVPLPATALLLVGALAGLGVVRRRRASDMGASNTA